MSFIRKTWYILIVPLPTHTHTRTRSTIARDKNEHTHTPDRRNVSLVLESMNTLRHICSYTSMYVLIESFPTVSFDSMKYKRTARRVQVACTRRRHLQTRTGTPAWNDPRTLSIHRSSRDSYGRSNCVFGETTFRRHTSPSAVFYRYDRVT